MIHPTAVIEKGAHIGSGTVVGTFAVVEAGAVIGENCTLASHAVIRAGARIGNGCRIDSFAVVGGDPNHLDFDPTTDSTVEIGAGTVIRESVTIHRSIDAGGTTRIGTDCFLMAGAHVAHDCELGDRTVMANAVLLAGHVAVGADCFFGGNSAVHQFVRIGRGAMIGGTARITKDVAPFCMVSERDHFSGLNLVGLRRRGTSPEAIRELKSLCQSILRAPGQPSATAAGLGPASTAEGDAFLRFFEPNKRGYVKHIPSRG